MKKKHTWANAIPKTRREKDILGLIKNPAEFQRMMNLLDTANQVTKNVKELENGKFKSVEDIVAFVSCRISDELPGKDVLLEELNEMMERYEERILSREGSDRNSEVQDQRKVSG